MFITGAGNGIGQATARRFGGRGAVVIVTDRDRGTAAATAESIRSSGGRSWECDLVLTDPERWEIVFREVVKRFGVPRVVVNNAGYTTAGAFLDHSAQNGGLVAVSARGVVTGLRMAVAYMRDNRIRDQIITVASVAAYTPLTVSSPSCTTKDRMRRHQLARRGARHPFVRSVHGRCWQAGARRQRRIRSSVRRAAEPRVPLDDEVRGEDARRLRPCGTHAAWDRRIDDLSWSDQANLFATAIHSAQTEEEASDRSVVVDAATEIVRNLRIVAGPGLVVCRIELAVRLDLGRVLVRPEAFGVYLLCRASPSPLCVLTNAGFGAPTIELAFRASRAPRVRRLLGVSR